MPVIPFDIRYLFMLKWFHMYFLSCTGVVPFLEESEVGFKWSTFTAPACKIALPIVLYRHLQGLDSQRKTELRTNFLLQHPHLVGGSSRNDWLTKFSRNPSSFGKHFLMKSLPTFFALFHTSRQPQLIGNLVWRSTRQMHIKPSQSFFLHLVKKVLRCSFTRHNDLKLLHPPLQLWFNTACTIFTIAMSHCVK